MHVVMDHGQVQKISVCSVCCPWFGFCTVSAGVESIVAVQIFYPILHLSLSQSLVFTSNDSPIAKSVQSHMRHKRVLVLAELLAVLDQDEAPGAIGKLLMQHLLMARYSPGASMLGACSS